MDLSNRRPLAVINGLQHMLAMRHNNKLSTVVEREGLLGENQFGFRKGRSTTDALFVLLTMVQKCKLKSSKLTMSFLDIQKAYDRVWRKGLYYKMECMGLGGRTLEIIKSLYHNDSLRFVVNGKLTSKL